MREDAFAQSASPCACAPPSSVPQLRGGNSLGLLPFDTPPVDPIATFDEGSASASIGAVGCISACRGHADQSNVVAYKDESINARNLAISSSNA